MKNKVIHIFLLCFFTGILLQACKKDSFTPVDMSELNEDDPTAHTALDDWLDKNFLDPYNARVIYRYHRYYHEADRNVSPPDVQYVQPTMQMVLDGFVDPYLNIAGETFVKENLPREWVLYGSTSYDASDVGYAGTASGGVRINLFGLNNFTLTPSYVESRLQVIHHEYTHILNQRFIMPADFQEITKAHYNGNWKSVNGDSAHKWGYVTAYASQNPVEDFAETTSHLLVEGQPWYDYWVATSGSADGQAALRAKEHSVVEYFNSSLNIDFRALQKEVQTYLKNVVKDPSVTFSYWLDRGLYTAIRIQPGDALYDGHPLSSEFLDGFKALGAAIKAFNPIYTLDYIEFRFESSSSLVVRARFTNTSGNEYFGDYSFDYNLNTTTGEITFTKIDQADGTTFSNGNLFLSTFENTLQKYLEDNTFVADWLPLDAPAALYNTTGGFYVKGDPANDIFGTLIE